MLQEFVNNLKNLLGFTNHIPNDTWVYVVKPILGRDYDDDRCHDVFSFEFWWREFWHVAGGLFVGSVLFPLFYFLPIPRLVSYALPVIGTAIVVGLKEFLGDASEQENGWDFKNVVDTFAWTLGALIISVLGFIF